MKKILSCTIILVLLLAIGINANTYNVKEAEKDFIKEMETYISNSSSDLKWRNFKIKSFDFVYDLSLVPYGYVFELENNKGDMGYGIAVYIDGKIRIVESSCETASPFYNIKTDNNIFVSPLEYFSFENKTKNHSNNINIKDLTTGKNYNLNELINVFTQSDDKNIMLNNITRAPATEVRYIRNLSSSFNYIPQQLSTDCIPTSAAMALKYLHNDGQIKLNITSTTSIRNKINEYMCGGSSISCAPNDVQAMNAINKFGINHSSPKISTRNDGFWGDLTFNTIIDEINNNCPMIMMFNSGVLANVRHATTCVGYKTLKNGATITDAYVLVKDPNGGNSSTKEVAWNGTNIHGYYLVYIG